MKAICGTVQGKGYGAYDLITVNPPYMPMNGSDLKLNEHQAIARHEIHCTLEEVIESCARLLKQGGKMSMVHKPLRLAEIITLMSKYRIEPKVIRFVHPRVKMEANMVLIEGIRDGKPEVRLKPPLIVYDEQGITDRILWKFTMEHMRMRQKNEKSCATELCRPGSRKSGFAVFGGDADREFRGYDVPRRTHPAGMRYYRRRGYEAVTQAADPFRNSG